MRGILSSFLPNRGTRSAKIVIVGSSKTNELVSLMPATVRLFRDVDRPPERLFADTSFVDTLLEWALTPEDPRCAAAHAFYQRIRVNNCALWTTPFTAEEILWR